MEKHGLKEMRLLEIGRGSSIWQCVGTRFEGGHGLVVKTDYVMNRINTAESSNVKCAENYELLFF
jgi:tRNA A58 N-methylase Trm61